MKETIDKIAKLFVRSLTLEEIEYCTREESNIGFSALHDRFCANEALLAVIDKFVRNDVVPEDCPDDIEKWIKNIGPIGGGGQELLNKCVMRINEMLKTLCDDGFHVCTQEIFEE